MNIRNRWKDASAFIMPKARPKAPASDLLELIWVTAFIGLVLLLLGVGP